jgi:large subunit ribosomal protein L25
MVLSNLDSVEVEAIPSLLPDFIEYDAEKLVEAGDSVTVADLIVPKGVEVKEDPNHAIATVYEPSALEAANKDAGGTAEQEALAAETEEAVAPEDAPATENQPEKSEDK